MQGAHVPEVTYPKHKPKLFPVARCSNWSTPTVGEETKLCQEIISPMQRWSETQSLWKALVPGTLLNNTKG